MTTGRSLRIGEAILGGVVLGLGLFIAIETSAGGGAEPCRDRPAPVSVPDRRRAWSWSAAWSSAGLLRPHRARGRLRARLAGGGLGLGRADRCRCFLLESLGWIIATTLLFVAATLAFRERRVLISIAIGIVLTGLAFWVFNYGLGLTLPDRHGLRAAAARTTKKPNRRPRPWKPWRPSATASPSR